jgi:hypothetical protein
LARFQINPPPLGARSLIADDTYRHLSMLRILYGASSTALDVFRAADNPVDEQLVADLDKMVERTRGEIERLAAILGETG